MARPEPHGEPVWGSYAFGDFELDVCRRVVRRGRQELTLRPKSFDVLHYLIRHQGQRVTKAALMDAVWPDTAVTDNSLAQCLVEIRRVLEDDSQQVIRTIARRGYVFAAPVTKGVVDLPASTAGSEPEQAPLWVPPAPHAVLAPVDSARSTRRLFDTGPVLAGVAATAVLGFLAWRIWFVPMTPEPFRPVPLNSLPGVQRYPSFSPDGNHVAFTWTGGQQDNQDIYIQQIGSGEPLRLTTDARIDYNPVWSPDGRWIAFLRRNWAAGTSELRLIPLLRGPEHKIADIRIADTYYIVPPYQTWCPDSSCLIVTDSTGEHKPAALFLVPLDTGEKRQLTHPEFPAIGDSNPAISLDGNWMVFRRQANLHGGELYRLRLRARPKTIAYADPQGLIGAGELQRLTPAALDASHPAFISGNELLFSSRRSLWKLVQGKSTPERLPFAGEDGMMPAISPSRPGHAARLAYIRSFQDTNIWRLDLSAPGAAAATAPRAVVASTRMDSTPQLSPDGRRLAFVSDRSGAWEIWLADSDGSNAVKLTSMGADSGAPCWSPDGERIVFQSNPEGQFHIYLVPAIGGKPEKLTAGNAANWRPSFSRNGRWVYFASNQQGQHRIWKMPPSGGNTMQVTTKPGFAAFESPDGAWLYYNQTMATPSPLWRQPVSGGAPVKVLEGVVRGAFTVVDSGVYYIDRPSNTGGLLFTDHPSGETRLQYYNLATRRTSTVARNLGNMFLGLTASRNGHMLLYSRVDSSIDDLMLVDNFR